jgi:hypothetical protein
MNFLESSSCWVADSGKAASPAIMPPIMKTNDTIDQITPQHCEEPPYLCANTLASDSFTFRRIRSSHYYMLVKENGKRRQNKTYNIPNGIQRRHDPNEQHHIFQRLRMLNKPTRNQQPHRQRDRDNRKPILPGPPQRKQKADPKHNTSNLAGYDIKSAEYEQSADERRAKVSSR